MPRKKKKEEPEYILHMFHARDEETRTEGVEFVIRTVKEFVSFSYEILLSDQRSDKTIELKISGIHAPIMIMPGMGPAIARRFYPKLSGRFRVVVQKLNKEINEFDVAFKANSVEILRTPDKTFVLCSTEPYPST